MGAGQAGFGRALLVLRVEQRLPPAVEVARRQIAAQGRAPRRLEQLPGGGGAGAREDELIGQRQDAHALQPRLPRHVPLRPGEIEAHLPRRRLARFPRHACGAELVQVQSELRAIGVEGVGAGEQFVEIALEAGVGQQARGEGLRIGHARLGALGLQVGIFEDGDHRERVRGQRLGQVYRLRAQIGPVDLARLGRKDCRIGRGQRVRGGGERGGAIARAAAEPCRRQQEKEAGPRGHGRVIRLALPPAAVVLIEVDTSSSSQSAQ